MLVRPGVTTHSSSLVSAGSSTLPRGVSFVSSLLYSKLNFLRPPVLPFPVHLANAKGFDRQIGSHKYLKHQDLLVLSRIQAIKRHRGITETSKISCIALMVHHSCVRHPLCGPE